MKVKYIYSIFLLGLILISGCTPPQYKPTKTSLELQAFQTKEYQSDKKIIFSSVLSVFQDLGYNIQSSELETGFISAKSPVQNETGFGKMIMKNTKATAFKETFPSGKTKVRLNFVNKEEWSGAYGGRLEQDTPVEDPQIYNNAFQKINEAILIRTAIN